MITCPKCKVKTEIIPMENYREHWECQQCLKRFDVHEMVSILLKELVDLEGRVASASHRAGMALDPYFQGQITS